MRFDKGWIKLWRMDDDHWLNKDILSKCLWYEILLMANYKTSKLMTGGILKELPPGSVVTSTYELAGRLGLCRKSIDKRLNLFKNDLMIDLLRTPLGTIITICNWNKYQGAGSDEVATEDTTVVATVVTTPVATVVAISKEDKKERMKEEKKNKDVVSNDASLVLSDIWNQTVTKLPKIQKITDKRAAQIKRRLIEYPDLEQWRNCILALDSWRFGTGNNDRGWIANFDYLLKPDTMVKFLESGFHNNIPKEQNRKSSFDLEDGGLTGWK